MSYKKALTRIEKSLKTGETELDLSFFGLKSLPPEIGKLTNLTMLRLGNNQLTVLPPEIGKLTKPRIKEVDKHE